MPDTASLRDDLLSIWTAGVDAVRAPQLMAAAVQSTAGQLTVCGETWNWADLRRIVVVGAGKAGAGMAEGLETILGSDRTASHLTGWVNVPADCVRPLQRITLHPGRPAGVNEPTPAGLNGAEQILHLVESVQADELCLVLLSGGGSALLPAPVASLTLEDKLAVTRFLMASGATINELNCVRKHLSRIKGGGLARHLHHGRLITLIISDVVGDPLDIIASGPTTPDTSSPADALRILERFQAHPPEVPEAVFKVLQQASAHWSAPEPLPDTVRNIIIGNNQVALKAAAVEATRRGYLVQSLGSENQGEAAAVGQELADRCLELRSQRTSDQPLCLLSGGEPVVKLAKPEQRGKGGRNQQLVLSALNRLWDEDCRGLALLSGGTDGEDGPTDAAGAWLDEELLAKAHHSTRDPLHFLQHSDAYHFFQPLGGLLRTGPTHTNVMDLRVALIRT